MKKWEGIGGEGGGGGVEELARCGRKTNTEWQARAGHSRQQYATVGQSRPQPWLPNKVYQLISSHQILKIQKIFPLFA